ncbi:MAG: AAA family ATPase [Coxiellaceae bacterium]|nr:AAA family ATPase [Coxiellaceae bacterium]
MKRDIFKELIGWKSKVRRKPLIIMGARQVGKTITADTLIIFDEIQECPNALNSLKYFNESKHDYHICAAGSLLGVKIKNTQGFPVGQVEQLHLHPLSFFEFLSALDELSLRRHLENINSIQPINHFI